MPKTYKKMSDELLLVDLDGKILGRAATKVADMLRGKDKPTFMPNVAAGHTVVAINAGKIKVTGKKMTDKKYYRFSGYPGGLREESLASLMEKRPEEAFRRAVKGMLPKNKLQNEFMKHLKVYANESHPHDAQNPRKVEV